MGRALSDEEQKLQKQKELLLKLRGKMQRAYRVQPFKIMTDVVIDNILKAQPTTYADVHNVKGFPEGRFRDAKFGRAIATIIRNWDEIDSIELMGNNEDGYNISIGMKKSSVFGG